MTRFPYYSAKGITWWSDNPEYAQTYADYYDSKAHGNRTRSKDAYERNVTGKVFQAYFHKNIEGSLDLQGPEEG